MENKNSKLMTWIIYISIVLWTIIFIGCVGMFVRYIFNNPEDIPMIIAFIFLFVFLFRNSLANWLKNKKLQMKERQEEREIQAFQQTLEVAKKLGFSKTSKSLTDRQKNALNNFLKSLDVIASNNSVLIERPECSEEELYALLFTNRESITVKGISAAGQPVCLEIRNAKGSAEILNMDDLESMKPIHEQIATKKSSKNTRKINALRKERKLKAEAKANGLVYKNGKLYQPPNYVFLANEWVSQNIGLINKIIIDNDIPTSLVIKGLILAENLPSDKNTWKHIGQNLVETDNIDRYVVQKNGLQIMINK